MISDISLILLMIFAIRGFIISLYENIIGRELYRKFNEIDEYMKNENNECKLHALQVISLRLLLSKSEMLISMHLESSLAHLKRSLLIHQWRKETLFDTFLKEIDNVIKTIHEIVGMTNDGRNINQN